MSAIKRLGAFYYLSTHEPLRVVYLPGWHLVGQSLNPALGEQRVFLRTGVPEEDPEVVADQHLAKVHAKLEEQEEEAKALLHWADIYAERTGETLPRLQRASLEVMHLLIDRRLILLEGK
jgi:hypothetical protein